MKAQRAAILGIASYLPPTKLTNEQLAAEFGDWTAEKILEKTGVAVRSIAAADETASDLAVRAAERLFESGQVAREEIDYLIFCTQSPDYFLPTTACTIQSRLGLSVQCGAFDMNQGCSGFVYALSLAKGLIETGQAKNVLLLTAETYSKFINDQDRSVRTIFSDGAAATWVGRRESDTEMIGPFVFGTDGTGARNLIVPAGGARRPFDEECDIETVDRSGNRRSARNLYMNGPEIFVFTLSAIPEAINRLMVAWGHTREEVDLFVFHQANSYMLERLRAKLKIPTERFWVDMEMVGNTVSSTIPIALESALAAGAIGRGALVALVGFGVGYSWAAAMIRIP